MAARSKGPRKDLGKQRPANVKVDSNEVPADLTVAETESWVNGDSARARAAIAAEQKRDNPRSTVLNSLERLADDQTGIGVETGEA